MALINFWKYTRTLVDGEKLLEATRNTYRALNSRPYNDKKGKLPNGRTYTLQVLFDDMDYGVDKKTGEQRKTNKEAVFEATVYNTRDDIKCGDIVKLIGFDQENSFSVDFSQILRFKDIEVVKQQANKPHA